MASANNQELSLPKGGSLLKIHRRAIPKEEQEAYNLLYAQELAEFLEEPEFDTVSWL